MNLLHLIRPCDDHTPPELLRVLVRPRVCSQDPVQGVRPGGGVEVAPQQGRQRRHHTPVPRAAEPEGAMVREGIREARRSTGSMSLILYR